MQTRIHKARITAHTLLGLFIAGAVVLLPPAAASAEERVLSHAPAAADSFDWAGKDANEGGTGHTVAFELPKDLSLVFAREVTFFAKRSGLGTTKLGNVVIWEDNPPKEGEKPEDHIPYRIVTQKNFNLADVPEAGGWVTVPLDTVQLPRKLIVAVYCYGTKDASVQLGLGPKSRAKTHSGILYPLEMGLGGKGVEKRRDGREWLIALKIADTIQAASTKSSADLSGPQFSSWDDGSAEGFDTMQTCGSMVKFHLDQGRKVKRIWVYGKLEGEWFKSSRRAGCWLMNDRWGILNRQDLAYSLFTNEAAWVSVDFPSIDVSGDFYVLVEPVSRPQVGLLVGYDSSGENKGSLYGNAGAVQVWECQAPEESTNWMIRVEYE